MRGSGHFRELGKQRFHCAFHCLSCGHFDRREESLLVFFLLFFCGSFEIGIGHRAGDLAPEFLRGFHPFFSDGMGVFQSFLRSAPIGHATGKIKDAGKKRAIFLAPNNQHGTVFLAHKLYSSTISRNCLT